MATACLIVWPFASGTLASSLSPGPDATLSVMCVPVFDVVPADGDCETTVPIGSSLGT